MNPHLSFNGDCEEAFCCYAECLGGTVSFLLRFGDSPLADQTPERWRNKVLHATVEWDGHRLTGADVLPGTYRKPQGFAVLLSMKDPLEADRLFARFAEGGEIRIPILQTFWALRYGEVVDRFGTPWMINCSNPATS